MKLHTRILHKLTYLFQKHVMANELLINVETWYRLSPTQGLLTDHHLPSNPTVWDVGGFTGEWTEAFLRYHPTASVQVFEPLPQYVKTLHKKFGKNAKITIQPYGLSDADTTVSITLGGEGSSQFRKGGQRAEVPLRNVTKVWGQLNTKHIHLMALNAEGAEYHILPAMAKAGLLAKTDTLLIQFHNLTRSSAAQRRAIHTTLAKTHTPVFIVPWVWEKWVKKPA